MTSPEQKPFVRRNLARIVGWTLVAQWFIWVGFSAFSDGRYIGCSNWHGEMLPCSAAEVLLYSIPNVLLLNLFTVGVAFVVVFVLVACVIALIDNLKLKRSRWLPAMFAVVLVAFLVAVFSKDLYVRNAAREAAQNVPEQEHIIILRSSGKATVVDPAPP